MKTNIKVILMKKMLYALIAILAIGMRLNAQTISYIIPDIGAPGMNTYMEIIAPTLGFGNFGKDGIIQNPLTDPNLKIEFQNPDDSKKISFGPLVVSWDGRMISTQVFVNPKLTTPNSSKWNELSSENIINFKIVKGATSSSYVSFYIVKPFNFGDLRNSSEAVFGEGALGIRSPRGCMIVDSLNLNSITYKVSTADCDPNTAGNQGYLPFVLLSKGPIIGKTDNLGAAATTISVNADDINGGPGGGGGGGKFCDYGLLGSCKGSNGGDGFVGGGFGGVNGSGIGSNSWKSYGSGTGIDGNSINGVARPFEGCISGGSPAKGKESAGGGAGHPFGTSGKEVCDGNADANAGEHNSGYGGGTGFKQKKAGGAGGYATAGSGSNAFNGGKVNGNDLVVPIAGGSGGASGNPQDGSTSSGDGGGGGGAIRVFADSVANIIFMANGGDGKNGDNNSDGGGGSGGHIGIFSKVAAKNLTARAIGGKTGDIANAIGGAGRVRLDVIKSDDINNFTMFPNNASYFNGVASDSTKWVNRAACKVKGRKNSASVLDLYLKSENGNWNLVNTIPAGSDTWNTTLTLAQPDSIFYFMACQKIDGSGRIDTCSYKPSFDMSQAAANILKVDKFPKIDGDKEVNLTSIYCVGNTVSAQAKITNTGLAPLLLKLTPGATVAKFQNNTPGLTWEPQTDLTVAPGSETTITIKYTVQDKIKGLLNDVLLIGHNDLTSAFIPWQIKCNINIDDYQAKFYDDSKLKELDSYNFGITCQGAKKSIKANIKNSGSVTAKIEQLVLGQNNKGFTLIPSDNETFNKGEFIDFKIEFAQTVPGIYRDTVYFKLKDCPLTQDTLILSAEVVKAETKFASDTIDFGPICIGQTLQNKFKIYNKTKLSLDLHNINYEHVPGLTAAFTGNNVLNPEDSLELKATINAAGATVGKYKGYITFYDQNCGDFRDTIWVKCEIQSTKLSFSTNIQYPTTKLGDKNSASVTLTNTGTAKALVKDAPILKAPFYLKSTSPNLPTIINPGESIVFNVDFSPSDLGEFFDTLRVSSLEMNGACSAIDSCLLSGKSSAPTLTLSKYLLDYGLMPSCKNSIDSIEIINNGDFDATIDKMEIFGLDASYFSVIKPDPNRPLTIKKGEKALVYVKFTSNNINVGAKSAELSFVSAVELPKVKLQAKTEEIKLTLTPASPVNLGAAPIGDSKTIKVTIKNNNESNINISNISATNSAQVSFTTLSLASGESKDLEVICPIAVEGANSYDVNFTIDSPCPAIVTYNITTIGLEGKFDYNPSINYGLLSSCETKQDKMEIENKGEIPIQLVSAQLSDINANDFTIVNPITTPIELKPGEKHTINVIFDPRNDIDGVKFAKLTVTINHNSKTSQIISFLSGEKRSGVLAIPSELHFSSVRVNKTSTLGVQFKNIGMIPIIIDSISGPSDKMIFTLNTYVNNYPLNVNESVNISMKFSPKLVKYYSDKVTLYYSANGCQNKIDILIDGTGIPASILKLRLPDIKNIDPRMSKLTIPIYAKIIDSDLSTIENLNLKFDISFNGILYYPNAVSSNSSFVQNYSPVNNIRTMNVEIKGAKVDTNETIIAEIYGSPLLGNETFTPLVFANASSENINDIAEIQATNGSLAYLVCDQGGDRLINYREALNIKVSPNPPSDKINIEVDALESGAHTLSIIDMSGNEKTISAWSANPTNPVASFSIDSKDFSSGAYFLVVKGPNRQFVKRIQLNK
jgi:hypothetical protein